MALNIIKAKFTDKPCTWTDYAWQWDYGQILQFEGLELPEAYEVHFSNIAIGGESITQIGGENGVTIPDQFFTTGETIYAWIYLHQGEDDGETVYSVTIPVKKRPQPSDTPPTPQEQSAIDQAIAALNVAVEKSETAITHYPHIQDGTWWIWDVTTKRWVDTQVEAQGEQGVPGQPGQPGEPGEDGFSPTITVTDITGGHRVIITDAGGDHSFDVMDGETPTVDAGDVPYDDTETYPDGSVGDGLSGVKAEINQLGKQINGTVILTPTEKTVSDFESIKVYITTNVGYWSSVYSSNKSCLIPLGNCKKVSITANSTKAALVAFLSDGSHESGTKANIVGGTLPTSVAINQTYEADVPDGATYFYVYKLDNDGYNRFPAEVLFYTYESAHDGLVDEISAKIDNYQSTITNPCIQPLSIDQDAELYKTIKTFNGATVSYSDNKIVLQPVNVWSTTQQWVIFGDSAIPVANYIPLDTVSPKATLEFDYSTTAENAKIYFTNKTSSVYETKLTSGNNIHFKKQYNSTTVGNVFFNIEYASDAGKPIYVSNIRLYYGDNYDGTDVYDYIRYIAEKNRFVSAAVQYNKLLTIGDSLSNICPWQPYVQDILNIPSMTKAGGVGYTVANLSANSIYQKVHGLSLDANVDLIVFWGGTNDYGQSVVIGDFDTQLNTATRDNTTFYGAYMDCVEYLLSLYPDKRIVLVGTIIRTNGGQDGKEVDARTRTNSAGNTLVDYVDATKKIAEWYGLPFIDLMRTAGINMDNIDEYLYIQGESSNLYYLHLNDWGSEQIGKRIGSFIKAVG